MSRTPRTLAVLGLLVVVLVGCSLSYPPSRKFALLVGIDTNPHTNALAYCVDDATDMRAMLVSRGFSSLDVILEIESDATKDRLVADIAALAQLMGPDDLFVFYYSGHGAVVPVQGENREWIVPWDSVDAGGDLLPDAAIFDSELGDMLDVLPTRRRVVILDSCFSGGFIGDGLEVDTVPPSLFGAPASSGWITPAVILAAIDNYSSFTTADYGGISPYHALTIAAAGARESSFEWPAPYNHGVLTYYLLQSPTLGDLNGDGAVTVLEMFALAKAGIETGWNQYVPYADWVFFPHISGGAIDLVLFDTGS